MDALGEVNFVVLENSSSSLRVIAPYGEKLGCDLAIIVAEDFSNESLLTFCNLLLHYWYVAGMCSYCLAFLCGLQ